MKRWLQIGYHRNNSTTNDHHRNRPHNPIPTPIPSENTSVDGDGDDGEPRSAKRGGEKEEEEETGGDTIGEGICYSNYETQACREARIPHWYPIFVMFCSTKESRHFVFPSVQSSFCYCHFVFQFE